MFSRRKIDGKKAEVRLDKFFMTRFIEQNSHLCADGKVDTVNIQLIGCVGRYGIPRKALFESLFG